MPSIDLQYVRSRQRGIRRAIERSSPVLVYSGPVGIVLIAANKSETRNRIGKVMDRIACVSRGELTASQLVHSHAAQNAYAKADLLSRGEEVLVCDAAVQSVSMLLANRYHTPIGEPLAVETIIVQLRETPAQDYMVTIGPDGNTRLFDRIHYTGATDTNGSREESEEEDSAEVLKQLNETLKSQWAPHPTVTELVASLKAVPQVEQLFTAGRRLDIVLLERAALNASNYEDIFKRLML